MLLDRYAVALLIGAPGAGKGTQARYLSEALGVPHVASGELLREHRRRGTVLGRQAQSYMDSGALVPDELVVAMVMERLERPDATHGVLLDGFPRTVEQAAALDRGLCQLGGAVEVALYLDVPRRTLVERLAGRWICADCQATYHERFSPSRDGRRCERCQGELHQRPDDAREVVEKRVAVFLSETRPVVERYKARGILRSIDGNRPIDAVRADLLNAVGIAEPLRPAVSGDILQTAAAGCLAS